MRNVFFAFIMLAANQSFATKLTLDEHVSRLAGTPHSIKLYLDHSVTIQPDSSNLLTACERVNELRESIEILQTKGARVLRNKENVRNFISKTQEEMEVLNYFCIEYGIFNASGRYVETSLSTAMVASMSLSRKSIQYLSTEN